MFKENYMQELAIHNIKNQRHLYKYMIIALIMSFFFSSLMSIMFSSYEQLSYEERVNQYGKWLVAIDHHIKEDVSIDVQCEKGKMYFIADVYADGRMLGKLGSFDQMGEELVHLQVIKGTFPSCDDEIMIEQSQCEYLGIADQLHHDVEIDVMENGKLVKKKMRLVGILQDYSTTYPIEVPTFITYGVSDDYTLLLQSDNQLELMNSFVETEQTVNVTYNMMTYTQYIFSIDKYVEDYPMRYMEIMIIGVGIMGIVSTTLSVINKRTEYFVLMRTLGMTLFQIQKTILYECLFLMIPSVFIGLLSSFIIAMICLYMYHIGMNAPFVFVMTTQWVKNMILCMMMLMIGMFVISLTIYHIPLTYRYKQKVNSFKHHIRKLNIFSLSLQEIYQHQKMFFLLGFMASLLILMTTFLTSVSVSYFHQNNDIGFTHSLQGDTLTSDDFHTLAHRDHIEVLYFQYNQVKIHVDGLDNWDGDYVEETPFLPYQYWLSDSFISCYLDENNAFEKIISQQNFQGRLPQKENETLVIIPYQDTSTHRSQFSPFYSQTLEHHSLQIGDEIDIAEITGQKMLSQKLKVVGTVTYQSMDQKMNDLTAYGAYQCVVPVSTFSTLFSQSMYQRINIETYDNQAIHEMKAVLYETILKNKPDVTYSDELSMHMMMQMQQKRDFMKESSFAVLFIMGMLMIIYTQRKLRILSLKHDIGLMMTIGLTHHQLILIYLVYDVFVYILGVVFVGIYLVITNMNQLFLLLQLIMTPNFIFSLVISGVLMMVLMLLPVVTLHHQNIMDMLIKEE